MERISTEQRVQTADLVEELKKAMPGGVNSPVRSGVSVHQLPMVAVEAKGDMVVDVDGNRYIDYCSSWGAIVLGHADQEIVEAIQQQCSRGTSYGISCPEEGLLAEKVIEMVPAIEKVRFVSSGTEATMTAARLARGYTQRDLVIKFNGHYHGHADFFLVQAGSGVFGMNTTSSSQGVPNDIVKHTMCLEFNDLEGVQRVLKSEGHRVAAVIVEPVAGNMGVVPGKKEFLHMLRDMTEEIGALLIFDEVMTGFRVAKGGAGELYQIKPDLVCLGKIVGGGLPAAAIGGKKEVMDCLAPLGGVYQAGTLSGNPLAMTAGYSTLKRLQAQGVYELLEKKAKRVADPIEKAIERFGYPACIQRVGSMLTLFLGCESVQSMQQAKKLDTERFSRLFRYCFLSGIYLPPSQYEAWFITLAHTDEHLDYTAETVIEALARIYNLV